MAREDEIRMIAYTIWQQEGCCDGRDKEHWLMAEVVWLENQKKGKAAAPAKAPVKASPKSTKQTAPAAKPPLSKTRTQPKK